MSIYTDATGRYYLGDVKYGNHDILAPTTSYTKADKITGGTLNTDIESICTSLGYGFRRTGDLRNWITDDVVFEFSFPTEPTIARFALRGAPVFGSFRFQGRDNGITYAGSTPYTAGIFGYANNFGESNVLATTGETSQIYERQVCGSFSDKSFSLFFIRRLQGFPGSIFYWFGHASFWQEGTLPNFTSDLGKCSIFCSGYTTSVGQGNHYDITNATNKTILNSGDAFYNIVCADAQTPGTEHTCGFYALYNDSLLYPMMGRYHDLLYAQGTYIIGKPVKLDGSVFPDLGHNHWLPVSRWGTYTILMRCYSSIV